MQKAGNRSPEIAEIAASQREEEQHAVAASGRRTKRLLGVLVVAVLLGGIGAWQLHRVYVADQSAILVDSGDASWIKADQPTVLKRRPVATQRTIFRRVLRLSSVPADPTLRIRSFRSSRLRVNGMLLEPETTSSPLWVGGQTYQAAGVLREGDNEVLVIVENDRGPPSVLVQSALPGLSSGADWTTVLAGGATRRARRLAEGISHPIQTSSPAAADGLRGVALYLAGAFAVGFGAVLWFERKGTASFGLIVTPSRVLCVLLGAWVLLCANNLTRVPIRMGFDVRGHLEYIIYILTNGELPLGSEGWQMFQTPLYYVISAALYWLVASVAPAPTALYVPRLVSMSCGLVLIVIAHRCSVRAFPRRPDLQSVALTISATIPMSFYISQEIGNEPLAGALGAGVLALCLQQATSEDDAPAAWRGVVLGALFGLALLSKITLLLLLPVLAWVLWYRSRGARSVLAAAAGFVAAAGLVSGWYFLRNWMVFGAPIYLNQGFGDHNGHGAGVWWQDPGYRLTADLLRFGDAIVRPVWSGLAGFWDGLYASLWLDGWTSFQPGSMEFMVALAPMALPLTVALVVGMARIPRIRDLRARAALGLCAAAWICFVAGMAYVYLTLPIYSTVKATYALAMVPALGILAAYGLQDLLEHRWGRAAVAGYLCSWVLCVFGAFLVVKS